MWKTWFPTPDCRCPDSWPFNPLHITWIGCWSPAGLPFLVQVTYLPQLALVLTWQWHSRLRDLVTAKEEKRTGGYEKGLIPHLIKNDHSSVPRWDLQKEGFQHNWKPVHQEWFFLPQSRVYLNFGQSLYYQQEKLCFLTLRICRSLTTLHRLFFTLQFFWVCIIFWGLSFEMCM